MKIRDYKLDALRTIGILLIFLAHVDCPFYVRQVRIFDVILLVIISGYVYKKPQNFFEYVCKRIKRLAFPTWVFLTIFFIILSILKVFNIDLELLKIKTIISSYIFWSGIGFVWIIRIYLGTSILGPLLLNIRCNKNYIFILLYFFSEIINFILFDYLRYYKISELFSVIPYTLLFCYGYLLKENKIKLKIITIILGSLIGIFLIWSPKIVDISYYKYPPRLIYIWYGIFISNILFLIKDRINLKDGILKKFFEYIGKSTMWFYLLHIFIFYLLQFLKKYTVINWILEYIFLFIGSLLLLFIKDYLLKKVNKKYKNEFLKTFEG